MTTAEEARSKTLGKAKEKVEFKTFHTIADDNGICTIYEQTSKGYIEYTTKTGSWRIADHINSGIFTPEKKGKEFVDVETIYRPLLNDTVTTGQIVLSDEPEPCDSLLQLIEEIEGKIDKWLYISPEELPIFKVQIRIAIASWFLYVYDDIRIPERIAGLIGDIGTSGGGKKRWLTIFRMFAYRPIYLLNTSKIPSVFRMAAPWGNPTLLIDEADQKETGSEAEWVQFVNSRYDGTPIPRYNATTGVSETYRSFGLTALALRRSLKDEGTTGRMTGIKATISPIALPEVAGNDIYEEFRSIRNKLLYLRLKYYGKLKFVGTSGLSADQSWRGKETLTLFRVMEQIDPGISKDIDKISAELTKKEVENLSSTWDGLILNEMYAFISDDLAQNHEKNKGVYFTRTYTKDDKQRTSVLNLKYLADRLGASASEISRSMAQFKITTFDRFRVEGLDKPQRGVLMFKHPADTDRIFQRYVTEYEHQLLKISEQKKLDSEVEDKTDPGVPSVPDVPLHDIPNDLNLNNNTMDIYASGTCGTCGTEKTELHDRDSDIIRDKSSTPSSVQTEKQVFNTPLEGCKDILEHGFTINECLKTQTGEMRKVQVEGKLSSFTDEQREYLKKFRFRSLGISCSGTSGTDGTLGSVLSSISESIFC